MQLNEKNVLGLGHGWIMEDNYLGEAPRVIPSDLERQIAEYKRLRDKEKLRKCEHERERLSAESILEDEGGLRYCLCIKCFRRLSILKGFKIIQQQNNETIEVKKLNDRRANGLLPF